ncbi:GNAT family N-acetyltransferase [Anaeromicropila populeti]|uniref:Acetyltransferase (GNAT) domain-containing protein n=1 Tax=Anaeromicropila populeti TaxID=37658 RepID=A0A1I6KML1_9FIRM|nr:GNAT family N-acetyltransferase [Anaeromicropila populeti]SFR92441.1 Acetyltransferase (GNAT) domain-containing protein [Anaeromicropila populeti]
MDFVKVEKKYLGACLELAVNEYCLEAAVSCSLSNLDCKNYLEDLLAGIFESQYGMAAIENGKVAALLFQNLSELMTKEKMSSYAICKYAHDEEITKALVLSGFGIRCGDAIKDIREVKCEIKNTAYLFEELGKSEIIQLLDLKNGLQKHLSDSPVYFPHFALTESDFVELCQQRNSRFFAAKDGNKIIGYIEVDDSGETFITEDVHVKNTCGMFLDKNYRGTGLAEDLLNFVTECLRKEHIDYLSVDFETINPTALRFWSKHFEVYTYSYVRRIDERIFK